MLGVHCGGELGNKMAEIRHNMVLVSAWRGIKVSRYFLLFPSLFAKTNLENNFVFFSGNEYSSNFAFQFNIQKIGPCGSMITHNNLQPRVISFNVEQSTRWFVENLKLMRVPSLASRLLPSAVIPGVSPLQCNVTTSLQK